MSAPKQYRLGLVCTVLVSVVSTYHCSSLYKCMTNTKLDEFRNVETVTYSKYVFVAGNIFEALPSSGICTNLQIIFKTTDLFFSTPA